MWHAAVGLATLLLASIACEIAIAQSPIPTVPGFWRLDKYRPKPLIAEGTQVRFVTAADYPPFNYLNESGELSGFNIDIARAICTELELNCTFRAMSWENLIPEVERGRADAVVASIASSETASERLVFTDPYYRTPARFAVRLENRLQDVSPDLLAEKRVAVVKSTSHEAYLRAFFPESEIVTFETVDLAREALRTGKVEALFGDGIGLIYWIAGTASKGCCRFAGGPYLESRFFGEGIGIAMARGNDKLRDVLNYGLDRIRRSGTFEDIHVRYFPINLY